MKPATIPQPNPKHNTTTTPKKENKKTKKTNHKHARISWRVFFCGITFFIVLEHFGITFFMICIIWSITFY